MQDKYIKNGEVNLHYKTVNYSPFHLPVIFIPGLVVSADEFYDDIKNYLNFYSIIIDKRGLGKSDKPAEGYSAGHFVSDLKVVADAECISKFNLAGHSHGAGIACAYAVKYPGEINSLIIADYPPGIPAVSEKWAEMIRENYPDISNNFVNGMLKESVKVIFTEQLQNTEFPILILKGVKEDSFLSMEKLKKYSAVLKSSEYKLIENAGHEIFAENPNESLYAIEKFILG